MNKSHGFAYPQTFAHSGLTTNTSRISWDGSRKDDRRTSRVQYRTAYHRFDSVILYFDRNTDLAEIRINGSPRNGTNKEVMRYSLKHRHLLGLIQLVHWSISVVREGADGRVDCVFDQLGSHTTWRSGAYVSGILSIRASKWVCSYEGYREQGSNWH